MAIIQAEIYVECPHCETTNFVVLDEQAVRQRECDECWETFLIEIIVS